MLRRYSSPSIQLVEIRHVRTSDDLQTPDECHRLILRPADPHSPIADVASGIIGPFRPAPLEEALHQAPRQTNAQVVAVESLGDVDVVGGRRREEVSKLGMRLRKLGLRLRSRWLRLSLGWLW